MSDPQPAEQAQASTPGETQISQEPPGQPRIAVRSADDRLSAVVSVRPGPVASEQELQDVLAAAHVIRGIDHATLARLNIGLQDPSFEVTDEIIARGTAVVEGEDGRFEPLFPDGIQPGHWREDGTIDFRDRELLKPAQVGDALGRLRPARAGTAGCLVDGKVIPAARVREATLALGAGVECDAEGIVRAVRSGIIGYKASRSIDVIDHHIHEGPVDLHSGDLHMQGSLLIKGDVRRSFSVYATGDVDINGSVESGYVHAGGNARVKQGVGGGGGGMVSAEGKLSVHHAETAKLYAGGLLQIADTVHTELSADSIEVSGKLRGGIARAQASVIAREVGSPQGVETRLGVGEPLERPTVSAQRALERRKQLEAAKLGAGPPHRAPGERGKGGKRGRLQADIERAETLRLKELAQRREMLSRTAFIRVGLAHPGVMLSIGNKKLMIEHEIRASRFSLDTETRELRMDKVGS